MDDADPNRRRLTRDEAVGLLSRPLVGVFSSLSESGWIHSVPVHFLYVEDQVRFWPALGCEDAECRANGSRHAVCRDNPGQHPQLRLGVRTGDGAAPTRGR